MKKNKKTPLIDNPLRLPGQSIDTEIQRVMDDEASQYILIPLMALIMTATEWWRWYTNSAFSPKIFTVVAIIVVIFSAYKIIKIKKKLKNLRLGKEGEIAVGQYLELFREKGFNVLGVDPATEIAARATAQGILTVAEFFSEKVKSSGFNSKNYYSNFGWSIYSDFISFYSYSRN